MKIIDIGINLMHRSFNEDREHVIKSAAEAGVTPLIITGTNERSSAIGNILYLKMLWISFSPNWKYLS